MDNLLCISKILKLYCPLHNFPARNCFSSSNPTVSVLLGSNSFSCNLASLVDTRRNIAMTVYAVGKSTWPVFFPVQICDERRRYVDSCHNHIHTTLKGTNYSSHGDADTHATHVHMDVYNSSSNGKTGERQNTPQTILYLNSNSVLWESKSPTYDMSRLSKSREYFDNIFPSKIEI